MKVTKNLLRTLGVTTLVIVGALLFNNRPAQASSNSKVPAVTMSQAIETVLTANPGRDVIGVSVEREDDKLAWEVELDNNLEVYVDANNGKIIKTEATQVSWNLEDLKYFID